MRVDRAERVEPTEQTLAKLEADVILSLEMAGKITEDQERAAKEIARIRAAVARGLFGTSHLDNSSSRTHSAPKEPIDAMTGYEATIYSRRYLPWQTHEARTMTFENRRVSRLEIAMKICADNWTPEMVAQQYKGETKYVMLALRDSLDEYLRFMERSPIDAKPKN